MGEESDDDCDFSRTDGASCGKDGAAVCDSGEANSGLNLSVSIPLVSDNCDGDCNDVHDETVEHNCVFDAEDNGKVHEDVAAGEEGDDGDGCGSVSEEVVGRTGGLKINYR